MPEKQAHILIVDDDVAVITSLNLLFKQAGFRSRAAYNPEEAAQIIREETFDLIVLDLNFSRTTIGEEGLAFLKQLRNLLPEVPVILITAWASISLAVEGMKAGAYDFIGKPWDNTHLLNSVKTALSLRGRISTNPAVISRQQLDKDFHFENIIGEEPNFVAVLNTMSRICKTDVPVLITGESGTGKELIAEAIHDNSQRQNKPFVKVNLGGISSTLFESEMFGHKKGAFTDAKNDRVGRFELADTGTLFLDEIGDLDVNCQVKLLRVLQDRKFEVLGSSLTKTVDVRVICATNRHLEGMVEKNEFREDLYYRINLITLKLPSLRERPEDVPLLVKHYINNLKRIYRRETLRVSQEAMNWLKGLPWSGNIRELKNLVERTVLVADNDVLDIEDFSAQFYASPQRSAKEHLPAVGTMTLDEMEEAMIRKALEFYAGNISKVARSVGLSRGALYRRMEKYGLAE